MKQTVKKIFRPVLEEAEEFVKEAKRQVTGKKPRPKEILSRGAADPQQIKKLRQKAQQRTDRGLASIRMRKAQMAPQWRQRYQKIQNEQLAAAEEREKEAERSRSPGVGAKSTSPGVGRSEAERQKKKPAPSGGSALAATGKSQRSPAGLFGLGRKEKSFQWTAERKGRSPK